MKKFHVVVSSVYEVESESEAQAVGGMMNHYWPRPIMSGITKVFDSDKEYSLDFIQPILDQEG